MEDSELKYDYILHAEQNALLWRNPLGCLLSQQAILVSTKMPCDECSPMVGDLGIKCVYTNRQKGKSDDDPAKFRGLTYCTFIYTVRSASYFGVDMADCF